MRFVTVESFVSKVLGNTRSLRIYLPPSYDSHPTRRYPVVYMQDGQNKFTSETSFSGASWHIHRTVDRLVEQGHIQEIILVGIDNTAERFQEYSWQVQEGGPVEARGPLYAQFLIEEVLPYIDTHFRTFADADHRAVIGSSMGGLISFHLALQHPQVFAMAGCLSSAFRWGNNHTLADLQQKSYPNASHPKLWIDLGDCEEAPIKESRAIVQELLDQGWVLGKDLGYYEAAGAAHFETYWAERVSMALQFLFGEIGSPTKLQIMGERRLGMQGYAPWLNPVVCFEQGIYLTDLQANVTSINPDIVSLGPLCELQGYQPGSGVLYVKSHGLAASAAYTVVEDLPQMVTARLTVQVPSNTPDDAPLYFGLVTQPDFLHLAKTGRHVYQAELIIPRHLKAVFAFNRGSWQTGEVLPDAQSNFFREICVAENAEFQYTVKEWVDIPAVSQLGND